MAYSSKEVSENGWRLTTSLILVLFLLNYAYALISAHFSIVTKLEAEYLFDCEKKKGDREKVVHEWADFEIEKSKDFNEEHMQTVIDKYLKDLKRDNKFDIDNQEIRLFKTDVTRVEEEETP